jgi:hypothetical protein
MPPADLGVQDRHLWVEPAQTPAHLIIECEDVGLLETFEPQNRVNSSRAAPNRVA